VAVASTRAACVGYVRKLCEERFAGEAASGQSYRTSRQRLSLHVEMSELFLCSVRHRLRCGVTAGLSSAPASQEPEHLCRALTDLFDQSPLDFDLTLIANCLEEYHDPIRGFDLALEDADQTVESAAPDHDFI